MNTRRLILIAIFAAPAVGILAAAAQPVIRTGTQPQPVIRPGVQRQYAAWIPPGTYTAIVLNSSGDERRWAVSLMTDKINVPIVVPPNDNIVIEFKEGWTVTGNEEPRLVSNLVPFEDSALYNKIGERPRYVLSAWGITAQGPVQFLYREIRQP
jgi:hypothetical protein